MYLKRYGSLLSWASQALRSVGQHNGALFCPVCGHCVLFVLRPTQPRRLQIRLSIVLNIVLFVNFLPYCFYDMYVNPCLLSMKSHPRLISHEPITLCFCLQRNKAMQTRETFSILFKYAPLHNFSCSSVADIFWLCLIGMGGLPGLAGQKGEPGPDARTGPKGERGLPGLFGRPGKTCGLSRIMMIGLCLSTVHRTNSNL